MGAKKCIPQSRVFSVKYSRPVAQRVASILAVLHFEWVDAWSFSTAFRIWDVGKMIQVRMIASVSIVGVLGKVDGGVSIDSVREEVHIAGEPDFSKLHRELCRQLLRA